jgi:hypothetical protein
MLQRALRHLRPKAGSEHALKIVGINATKASSVGPTFMALARASMKKTPSGVYFFALFTLGYPFKRRGAQWGGKGK